MLNPFDEINKLLIIDKKEERQNFYCKHIDVIEEGTNKICSECGQVMDKDLEYDKEWRYYGLMDTKHASDPNRCNIRKSDEKTIYKDVEKLGISDKIISCANHLYEQVTKGKIYRGNTRKGIIFACIFHSYKLNNNPQSCETLINVFMIDRKIGLKGLKFVNLNASKESDFRNFQITMDHLITEVMLKFNAPQSYIDEAKWLYSVVKDRSSLLNRSRPQSVACGIVRYYIQKKNSDISMDYFRSKINLSELTITRIVKEIKSILET